MSAKIGRPSPYRAEMCETVIKYMRQGAAIKELPYYLGVCLDTIYEWRKIYPEFSEAIKTGEGLSEAVWMRKGRLNMKCPTFSYTGWYMNMKNRFGWCDKQENTHHITVKQEDAIKELE